MSFKNSVVFVFLHCTFQSFVYKFLFDRKKKKGEKKREEVITATVTDDKLITQCNDRSVSQLHLGFNLQFSDCTNWELSQSIKQDWILEMFSVCLNSLQL